MASLRLVAIVVLAGALAAPAGGAATGADRVFKPFALKALDGSHVTLSDVLGRATLVVFFFPTCTYCKLALPETQTLHDTYKDDGLSVIWINVVPEQEELIPEWRARHGFTVPILLGDRSVQKNYALTMTPTHYLLDSGGRVLARHAGFKRGEHEKLERRIREALSLNPQRRAR
jgi:cytochrome c biogenesis protein CcmG/thiol:disulfide interchange protein DsbE